MVNILPIYYVVYDSRFVSTYPTLCSLSRLYFPVDVWWMWVWVVDVYKRQVQPMLVLSQYIYVERGIIHVFTCISSLKMGADCFLLLKCHIYVFFLWRQKSYRQIQIQMCTIHHSYLLNTFQQNSCLGRRFVFLGLDGQITRD